MLPISRCPAPCLTGRRWLRILPSPRSSEETANGIGKLLPDGTPLGQRALAASGQCIDPPPSPGFGGHPATDKQARFLKPMQRGVDRSLREIERLAALAPDFLDHCITVRRPRR